MTRRVFMAASAGFLPGPVKLDALVAAQLPCQLVLPSSVARAFGDQPGILERRVYQNVFVISDLRKIAPWSEWPGVQWQKSLLLWFPSFEARAQAWTLVSANPHWQKLPSAYEFAIFSYPSAARRSHLA